MHLRVVDEGVTKKNSSVREGKLILLVAGSGDATLLCGASACGA